MSLRLLASLLLSLVLVWSAPARAESINISHISLEAHDDSYVLDADFEIELNSRLAEAVDKGVALYFEVEFELTRKRWYWFDERPVSRQLMLRLSYHALTRQYRISRGPLHQSVSSLSDALRVVSRIRSGPVLERGEIDAGTEYQAALRMRLDVTQLPKPFQVSALTSRDWNLASEWRRWPLSIKAPVTEKAPQ